MKKSRSLLQKKKKKAGYKVPSPSEKMRVYFDNPEFLRLMEKEVREEVEKSGFNLKSEEATVSSITRKFGINKIFQELIKKGIDPFLVNKELADFNSLMAGKIAADEEEKTGRKVPMKKEIDRILRIQMERMKLLADIAEKRIPEKQAVEKFNKLGEKKEEIRREIVKKIEEKMREQAKIEQQVREKIIEAMLQAGEEKKRKSDKDLPLDLYG